MIGADGWLVRLRMVNVTGSQLVAALVNKMYFYWDQ